MQKCFNYWDVVSLRALGSTLQTYFPFSVLCSPTQSRTEGRDQPSSEKERDGMADRLAAGVLGVCTVAEISRQPSQMSSYGQHRRRGQAPEEAVRKDCF